MKKTLKLFFIAALAIAAASCNKNELAPETENPASDVNYVNVEFGAVMATPSTKATLTPDASEATFTPAWENGTDAITVNFLNDDSIDVADAIWNGSYFAASLPEFKGEWLYDAVYPSYDNTTLKVEFGSSRTQTGNAFNSAYDLMASEANPKDAEAGKDDEGNPVVFNFERKTAIAYFHFTSDNSDETITKATLSVDGGYISNGYVTTNGSDFTFGDNTETDKTIETTVTGAPANDFTLWFNVQPTNYTSMTLTVETETKTFTISKSKSGSYAAGKLYKVKKEGISWTNKTVPPVASGYAKVTETPSDWSGEYLLVYEPDDDDPLCWTGVDAGQCHVDVTINDGVIAEVPEGAVTLTIAPMTGGYSIMVNGGDNDGQYIGRSNNSNGMDISSSAALNTLSISEGYAVITAEGGCTMRYNSSSGSSNERFRYYKSGQKAVQLYKLIETGPQKQAQTLSFPEASYTVRVDEEFVAPTVSGAQTTVTYSSSHNDVATVDSSTGAVTIVAPGTTTITATAAASDTYTQGTANYTLNVTTAPINTIDGIFSASGTEGNYTITFNNWVVSGVKNSNAYVTDGTKGFIIFKSGHGFEVGDILSGTATCALTRYNGSAEFTDLTASKTGITVTKGGTITPQVVNISDLSGINTGAVITVNNVTFDGTWLSDANDKTIKPYNSLYTYALTNGVEYNVTGVYLQYNSSTKEILPRSAEDIEEVVADTYEITIDSGITNGTVTSSRDEAPEGAEITLTVTPAEHYELSSLVVMNDESGDPVAVANDKFTMPAASVTVSATFVEIVATPVITIDNTGNASITCATTGATIYYAISDSEPSDYANTYNNTPVALLNGQTIWAKATKTNCTDSEVANNTYSTGGGEPKVLTFALNSNPGDWPGTNSTTLTDYTYTLNNVDYTFALKNVKCNSGYLMLTQPAALGLPAIAGYKLVKVEVQNSTTCSTSVNVGISSDAGSASYVSGGEAQKWATTGSKYTYNLSGTTTNTMYYLYVTSKNGQITSITLTYN